MDISSPGRGAGEVIPFGRQCVGAVEAAKNGFDQEDVEVRALGNRKTIVKSQYPLVN